MQLLSKQKLQLDKDTSHSNPNILNKGTLENVFSKVKNFCLKKPYLDGIVLAKMYKA
jgi:hypothetical protein